jgi:hypothetical protein
MSSRAVITGSATEPVGLGVYGLIIEPLVSSVQVLVFKGNEQDKFYNYRTWYSTKSVRVLFLHQAILAELVSA